MTSEILFPNSVEAEISVSPSVRFAWKIIGGFGMFIAAVTEEAIAGAGREIGANGHGNVASVATTGLGDRGIGTAIGVVVKGVRFCLASDAASVESVVFTNFGVGLDVVANKIERVKVLRIITVCSVIIGICLDTSSGGVFEIAGAGEVKGIGANSVKAIGGEASIAGACIGGGDDVIGVEEGGEFGRSGAINHTIW